MPVAVAVAVAVAVGVGVGVGVGVLSNSAGAKDTSASSWIMRQSSLANFLAANQAITEFALVYPL